jgi:hypothetical protein
MASHDVQEFAFLNGLSHKEAKRRMGKTNRHQRNLNQSPPAKVPAPVIEASIPLAQAAE